VRQGGGAMGWVKRIKGAGCGCRVSGLGSRVSGVGCRVLGLGGGVWGEGERCLGIEEEGSFAIWCDLNHCEELGLNLSYIEWRPNWSYIKVRT